MKKELALTRQRRERRGCQAGAKPVQKPCGWQIWVTKRKVIAFGRNRGRTMGPGVSSWQHVVPSSSDDDPSPPSMYRRSRDRVLHREVEVGGGDVHFEHVTLLSCACRAITHSPIRKHESRQDTGIWTRVDAAAVKLNWQIWDSTGVKPRVTWWIWGGAVKKMEV